MAYKPKLLTVTEGGTGLTAAGTSGNVLTSDGTNWTSAAPASSGFSPNAITQIMDDFYGMVTTTGTGPDQKVSNYGWYDPTQTWAASGTLMEAGHPGVVRNSLTIGAGGRAALFLGTNSATPARSFILGGGALTVNWVIKIATLSDGTNRYNLRFGLGDTTTAADQNNGVYFDYSDNLNSGNWVGTTASAGSRTPANSAIAANTNWHNFGITVNAAGTSVGFFIDGVEIANSPLALTIPTVVIAPFVSIVRAAGTVAADSVLVDLVYCQLTLTTPR